MPSQLHQYIDLVTAYGLGHLRKAPPCQIAPANRRAPQGLCDRIPFLIQLVNKNFKGSAIKIKEKSPHKLPHCMIHQVSRKVADADFPMMPLGPGIGFCCQFFQILTIKGIVPLHFRRRHAFNGIGIKQDIADFFQSLERLRLQFGRAQIGFQRLPAPSQCAICPSQEPIASRQPLIVLAIPIIPQHILQLVYLCYIFFLLPENLSFQKLRHQRPCPPLLGKILQQVPCLVIFLLLKKPQSMFIHSYKIPDISRQTRIHRIITFFVNISILQFFFKKAMTESLQSTCILAQKHSFEVKFCHSLKFRIF